MTVRLDAAGRIVLEAACAADDAEPLHQLLEAASGAEVDWQGCDEAHTAVIQLLLVARPVIRDPPRSPFLRRWIAPILAECGGWNGD